MFVTWYVRSRCVVFGAVARGSTLVDVDYTVTLLYGTDCDVIQQTAGTWPGAHLRAT